MRGDYRPDLGELPDYDPEEAIPPKPRPSKPKRLPGQDYAIGHDIVGNTFVAYRTRGHVDYIYGMFRGRELRGGHLDAIESWHREGEKVAFTHHPTKGNIVLVMGIPVREITGPEADKIIETERQKP